MTGLDFFPSNSVHDMNFRDRQTHINEISSGRKSIRTSSPAILQIGQRLLNRASRAEAANGNVNFALSRSRTIDSFQQQTNDSLSRLKELSIRAGDGTLSAGDKKSLNNEAQQILQQMDSDFSHASFNGNKILQGGSAEVVVTSEGDAVTLRNGNADRADLGLSDIDLSTAEGATAAMEAVASAEDVVGRIRTELGTDQQSLERQFESNLSEESNAFQAGSDLLVTDMAEALVKETSSGIKSSIGLAMQAQANKLQADVLQLLKF